jgi:hypothetical protein
MRCAEGGKIDTVVYNASCGALNCTAKAGIGAAISIDPIKVMAEAQNAGISPRLPDRCRLFASPILRHTSSQKIQAKTIAAVSRCQDRLHDSARETRGAIGRVNAVLPPIGLKTV